MVYVVGLTGGIGCGKSSTAKIFAEHGAAVIDTDEIAHRLTAPGEPGLLAVKQAFGEAFLLPDGGLDRAKMRRLVFSDRRAKARLEAILHPLIKERVKEALAACQAPYALVVVPLLLETGSYRELIRRVLVVDCEEGRQIERTTARSGLSGDEVRAIMAHQISRGERLRQADDVLSNNGEMVELQRQVASLHEEYLRLAARHKHGDGA
jgi:dephospho-CoA kinase